MTGTSIKVKALANGNRQVTVLVPLDLCIRPAGLVGDPVEQADATAREVAMHALADSLGMNL